ncbi:transposase [Bacillus sp. TH13]|uniref:transposase n=1 Tax=Bacillus sp. TH13 TaxID=2796379 RepID=UPI00191475E6|nr:transposase [Bacillus sp. TH13]MBK5491897.1 transposase [Bacillus sp. TH13]
MNISETKRRVNLISNIEAQRRYEEWVNQVTEDVFEAFEPILKACNNWHEEIFNYFEHPITNAYTESLNSLIRVMNGMGRGYSFEALRARILFTEGVQKKAKPLYQREHFIAEHSMNDYMPFPIIEMACNYGADISIIPETFLYKS